MPNWCFNKIECYGEINCIPNICEQFISIDSKTKESYLDFNKIIPMPEELKKTVSIHCIDEDLDKLKKEEESGIKDELLDEIISCTTDEISITRRENAVIFKKYNSTWYSWRILNWGVKWNSSSCSFTDKEIIFMTPWDEPVGICDAIGKKYPESIIVFSYYEPGICFGGYRIYKNGELYHAEGVDISKYVNDEDFGYEIIEYIREKVNKVLQDI